MADYELASTVIRRTADQHQTRADHFQRYAELVAETIDGLGAVQPQHEEFAAVQRLLTQLEAAQQHARQLTVHANAIAATYSQMAEDIAAGDNDHAIAIPPQDQD